MSYILDALRKADAQRQRDPARGIHAQSPAAGAMTQGGPAGRRPLGWFVAMALVALVAATAAYLVKPGASTETRVPEGSLRASVGASGANPLPRPPVMAEAAPADLATTPASVVLPPAPPITPLMRPPTPRPGRNFAENADATAPVNPGDTRRGSSAGVPVAQAPARTPQPVAPRATPGLEAQDPAALPGAPPSAPAAPSAPGAPQPRGAALPRPAAAAAQPPVGQQLPPGAPPLVVTGGVYSANPAQRMLIVNGQVFNEGAQAAPGVTVEEIRSGSAVLSFGGARFSVRY